MRSLLSLAVASFGAALASQTIVLPTIPTPLANAEGASSTAYAWGYGNSPIRVQYVYDSTHFAGITSPIVISRLRFRANGAATTAGYTYSNATVQMSSAAVDYLTPSTTFASNHGADLATVYQGNVVVATGAGTTPNNWYVDVPLTSNFLYDPTSGKDLCLDLMHDGVGATTTTGPAHDCATTGCLVTRIYSLGNAQSPTGSIQQAVGIVVELTYTPAIGLYAGFTSDVTSGPSPLTVKFTDKSFTSTPSGVTSWAWDFNGDNLIDSTQQNPTYVYTSCGSYDVSLTVTDGVYPANKTTKKKYIVTDYIYNAPSFTYSSITPGVIQFTDTTSPTPTSWSWDLNGDNIPDSTLQNPTWTYPSPCTATKVTLTVSRLCQGPFSASQTLLFSPLSYTTTLVGGNGLSGVGSGNSFDIQVTNPDGINICGFSLTPYMATPVIGAPLGCTIWITDAPGGYGANHTNPAVWRQVATGTGNFLGGTFSAPIPAPMTLSNLVYLPAGTYGMAVYMTTGAGMAYTTLTAPMNYPGPDCNVTAGIGKATAFAASGNANRGWNGKIHYSTRTNGSMAGYGFFGAGCSGSMGIARLQNSNQPVLGKTLSVTASNLPQSVGVLILAGSRTTWTYGALPFDFTPFGATGCLLRVSLDVTLPLYGSANTAVWNAPVPSTPSLMGVLLFNQVFVPDPTGNPFGATLSDAAGMILGT